MFEKIKLHLRYHVNGKKSEAVLDSSYENEDMKVVVDVERKKQHEKLKISIQPANEIVIDELFIDMDLRFHKKHKIFVNGYQSWTDSREFFTDEKLRSISSLALPMVKKYHFDKYGDYTFKKYSNRCGEFHGYTYSYIRDGEEFKLIGSLSERGGYTVIEEKVGKNKIFIHKDCKNHTITSLYIPFELVWAEGTEEEVFDAYFREMGIEKPRCVPMTGWTSWYNYYQDINEEIIMENLNNFKTINKNINIFQIDDGYQTAVGDWLSVDKGKFPAGMKAMAENIQSKGYKAGIWLAPFVCETNSRIFEQKKHWLLRDEDNELVCGGSNWSKFYALDFYHPEVRAYLKQVFTEILQHWGYDMVKLDFLYAVCLKPQIDRTRGQIMTEAMEFLRECVGDKLILGCGVPLGPSFGLVDYCRIGCDVGLDWDDKFYMRFFHRERISTRNSIQNAIGRRHLNGRAFLNDPDVFLLREDNISLSQTQKWTLSRVNKIFGSLLFTSDNIKKYDKSHHEWFDQIMNWKPRKINKVEAFKNGLIEVLYQEDDKRFLAVFNLGKNAIKYRLPKERGTLLYLENNEVYKNQTIGIKPYESKVFVMR